MNKKTLIIFTIIASIVSLGIILIGYFGVTRYMWCMIYPNTESFVDKFDKTPSAQINELLSVCIYAKRENIDNVFGTLHSLLDQTIRPTNFYLVSDNTKNLEIPASLREFCFLIPSRVNYGDPGNIIIPMLMKIKECNTILVAVNDNLIYGKDFLEHVINITKEDKDSVFVDSKNYTWVFRPKHYGCEFLDRKEEKYDARWFKINTNNVKKLKYPENYKNLRRSRVKN